VGVPPVVPDHEHLRMIYEQMTDGILIVDAAGVIVCANPAATRMLASGTGALVGESFGFPVVDRNAVVIDLLAGRGGVRSAEMRVADVVWRGGAAHLLSLRDITEQNSLLGQLERAANFDLVTGLPNRQQFHRRLDQAVLESRRHGGLIALLFIDLDDFKSVNDTYGHGLGDLFLASVGRRLEELLREGDSVARLAGDEFTVLLTQLGHPHEAEVVATKIVASLGQPFDVADLTISSSASIGIALFPQDADTGHALVRRADIAMYSAKHRGKGMYRLFEPA
jgi:diguanylate cyclase (GGDEF)-like protein